jgi:hypothetical protein
MCDYQQFADQQERQEYFADCVKVAVEKEVERIINSLTCFECDNPIEGIETEDGGISVRSCEKCNGPSLASDTPFLQALVGMDATISQINKLTKQINGGNGRG